MLVAKKLSAMSTIDNSIRRRKPLPAHRFGASVIWSRSLPMLLADNLVRVYGGRSWSRRGRGHGRVRITAASSRAGCRRGDLVVGLEDIESFELLIQHRERLKLLRLEHLCFEPVLNLILSLLLYLLV